MYNELYEYLVLNRQLNVPGIGTFLLEKRPAETDISHRQINASAYTVTLMQGNSAPAKKLFHWLADKLHIHYNEAIVRFNGFAYDLKSQVLSGNKIKWDNVGTLSKGISGDIKFESSLKDQYFDPPVSATKIIREKAVHTVRVGEEEKTSEEMNEWLNPADQQRSYWWAPALIAGILLVVVLVLYFSQRGINTSSVGNQQKLPEVKADASYKMLQ